MGFARKVLVTVSILVAGAAAQASAENMRGIYINGQVHLFCNGCDNYGVIRHRAGVPDSNMIWKQVGATQEIDSPVPPDYTTQVGQGLTVMNDTIYYFPLGDPGNSTSNDRYLACVQFDLTSNAFVTARTKTLSKIHQSGHAIAGSAAVTFSPPDGGQSVVYAFCDAATWSTGDGVNWASHPALAGSSYQPMDAVVYYPPDSDPRIVVIYNKVDGQYLDSGLYAAIWNGKFGTESSMSWTQLDQSDPDTWYGAALFLGTAAAASPYHQGQKTEPGVQLFANRPNGGGVYRYEFTWTDAGGSWVRDSGVWSPSYDELYAFPWYPVECSSSGDYQIQRQHLVLNAIEDRGERSELSSSKAVNIVSDAMIPINKDGQHIGCDLSWGGSVTDTGANPSSGDEAQTWQKYWSLLGVILGSPPFALNGWEGFELEPFSNIEIGADDSTDVSYSEKRDQKLLFSSGLTVSAGLEELGLDFENEVELSYTYGWESGHESSQSYTVHYGKSFGTESDNVDDPESLGKLGWAIFLVPKMLVQDYAIYAYDFDVNGPHPQTPGDPSDPNQNGTYLDQDLHSVEVLPNSSQIRPMAFKLEEPGSAEDTVPGLMTGMSSFGSSQDLDFWDDPGYTWGDTDSSLWSVLLGDQADPAAGEIKIESLTFVPGSTSTAGFSKDLKQIDTEGRTSDVEIKESFTLAEKCFLGGFKLNLSAGYDSEFSQEVTDTTSWSQNVEASLAMKTAKDPTDPEAVKSLTVQPYLLRATDASAPWIPDQYRDQRPWCITWTTQHEHYAEGGSSTQCPVPSLVQGKVVGGDGGAGDGANPNHGGFEVVDGYMEFDRDGRGESPSAPVGADDFDPALGATLQFNSFVYATSQAKGKWTRQGDIWKFKTKEAVKPQVLLKLDFGAGTWDLDLTRVDLEGHYSPSRANIRVALKVNGRDSFYTHFTPEVRTRWDLKVPTASPDALALTHYKGEYDSATGQGTTTLKGTLPKKPESFGDMAFCVNGHQVNAPLTSLDDFDKAVAKGGEISYMDGGLHLTVDFGKGKWKAKFTEEGFHPLLAPRRGSAPIRISVGGVTVYSQDHPIPNHTTKFSFAR